MTDLSTEPGAADESSLGDGSAPDVDDPAENETVPVAPEPGDDDETDAAEAVSEFDAASTLPLAEGIQPQKRSPAPASSEAMAVYAWAPPEPVRRRTRKPLWIGLAAGTAVVALIASSLVLIAPGTSVAGVGIGGLTPGGAADALQQRLAETSIVLTGEGGDAVLTAADLGASVDAEGLAEDAFGEHPMWNPTQWFSASGDAVVHLDEAAATAAVRTAAPDLFVEPVDATLAYDAATATYVTTPAQAGQGVDIDAIRSALQRAYDSGTARVKLDPALSPVAPKTTTESADATAATLNNILGTAGFYVGDERTVPVDRATAASWLSVTHQPDGTFAIAADAAGIQKVVDTLPAAVDRSAVNATVITDSAGKVLRSVTGGVAGRVVGDTTGVAAAYATQLAAGNAAYALPVSVTNFATTSLARRIEVNISEQRAYLFENGAVVYSYPISSGLPGHDTNLGHFRIYAKVKNQNMGNPDLTKAPNYYTPNVPNVSYFDGDEALHGAYWHHNFGHRMSHGCVNMPLDAAALVYDWAPIGTEVWVHS